MNHPTEVNYEITNTVDTTPRYGPLPTLVRASACASQPLISSTPMTRRFCAPPPPAYSDLDECDNEQASGGEPRYQSRPLHLLSRRPLPGHPPSDHSASQDRTKSINQRNTHRTSSSSESVEGDYEDISQL